MAQGYIATPTKTKDEQRDKFADAIMKVTRGDIFFIESPNGDASMYLSTNIDLMDHIKTHNLLVFAVNNEPNDNFVDNVALETDNNIIPYRGYMSDLLDDFARDRFIALLWLDTNHSPDFIIENAEKDINMVNLINRMSNNNWFLPNAIVMYNFTYRNKHPENSRTYNCFHRFKKSVGKLQNHRPKMIMNKQYGGKAQESGNSSRAGQMHFGIMYMCPYADLT